MLHKLKQKEEMSINELENRVDTVYSICCQAIMTKERYMEILKDKNAFSSVFFYADFNNPQITFTVDSFGEIYKTSKTELLNNDNHNLFKAWQIVFGIIGMTSIFESYLKYFFEKRKKKKYKAMGILYKIIRMPKINAKEFEGYLDLNKYYQVRHISVHNLGRIDENFNAKTSGNHKIDSPYIFYPQDLYAYKNLIISFATFLENEII